MLPSGSRFGPYEVLTPLGSGGMGEVYAAFDIRLAREIVLKVIREETASDPVRIRRFEAEARSASALNHPNIVTIHDIGSSDGVSYIAMERVEGRTLRKILADAPMAPSQILRVAIQIADGLARAHEAGIVHRDLKPENLMVTRDGLVKILDFGLAKLTASQDGREPLLGRGKTETFPGTIVGTVGYMSPEQASGGQVDFRSDQFAFGSILYEMATGVRAFHKATSVETLTAILKEDPPAIGERNPQVPLPLRWIVERCLEKDPGRRYASTRDLARDLENLRERSAEAAAVTLPTARRRSQRIALVGLAGLTLALSLFAGKLLLDPAPAPPAFQRLTFRRGVVTAARFTPDGQNVVYSARWGGQEERIFLERIGNPESLPLPFPEETLLFGVSQAGNLALALHAEALSNFGLAALLGIAPLAGGTPREIRTSVQSADFFPASDRLAIVVDGRLESPPGTPLYKDGVVGRARVSPRGDKIAIFENRDGAFFISVIDLSGKRTVLAESPTLGRIEGMSGAQHGLAWSSDGEEIFYSGGTVAAANSILAVSARRKVRTVLRVPGYLTVQDVAPDGRILLTTGDVRAEVAFRPADGGPVRDLAWFSMASANQFSADGTAVLIYEPAVPGGAGLYLRKTDGSPPFRLSDQDADTLSPNAAWVARIEDGDALLIPTGAGETRRLSQPRFAYERVFWFPGGGRLLVIGKEEGHDQRLYIQDDSGGALTPLSTEGISHDGPVISPDGALVAVAQPDGYWIYPVNGQSRWSFEGVEDGEVFASWSEDGRAVLTTVPDRAPFRVYRVDVRSGRRELWKVIEPSDPSGVCSASILLRPDGSSVMNAMRWVNDLFLVDPAH